MNITEHNRKPLIEMSLTNYILGAATAIAAVDSQKLGVTLLSAYINDLRDMINKDLDLDQIKRVLRVMMDSHSVPTQQFARKFEAYVLDLEKLVG